jgi:cyclic pyranopterin phosphate synthase
MTDIVDKYGRTFKTLRVSLTNACNLGCVYCVHGNTDMKEHNHLAHENLLQAEDMLRLIEKLHESLNLETVRLTGGEPLLYKDIIRLTEGLKNIGIPSIKITTNAFLLNEMAEKLQKAGVSSLNISLDAIDPETFFRISRRKTLEKILTGIEKAISLGMKVKLNTVVMRGINEDQILPLFAFAKSHNISIRFLELMKMGHLHVTNENPYFFSEKEILEILAQKYQFKKQTRESASTANYWMTEDNYRFGIIANESSPFCQDCNRLRLDSHGNIFGCLSSNISQKLSLTDNHETLSKKLEEALAEKQPLKFKGSAISMIDIGG